MHIRETTTKKKDYNIAANHFWKDKLMQILETEVWAGVFFCKPSIRASQFFQIAKQIKGEVDEVK